MRSQTSYMPHRLRLCRRESLPVGGATCDSIGLTSINIVKRQTTAGKVFDILILVKLILKKKEMEPERPQREGILQQCYKGYCLMEDILNIDF